MKKNWIVLSLLMFTVLGWFAAKEFRPRRDETVDRALRSEVIDTLVTKLNAHYVFPEKARQIETLLRQRQQQGKYDRITNGFSLAKQLNTDLHAVARDLHMQVQFRPGLDLPDETGGPPSATPAEWEQRYNAIERFVMRYEAEREVKRVEILDHNIGYLKITGFPDAYLMTGKFAAAMDELAGTDGLIVDVSPNAGGDPDSVALLISYFVERRTRLNDIYNRTTGNTVQQWTQDRLDGKRYGGKKPVYILVGPRTGSAGEDFAYTMQALKRATLVGKPTWGGANAVRSYRIGGHFVAQIPGSRSISPITGTNWEGVGVIPDIEAERVRALSVAHGLLRRQLQGSAAVAAAAP
jgi:hypothetical protein